MIIKIILVNNLVQICSMKNMVFSSIEIYFHCINFHHSHFLCLLQGQFSHIGASLHSRTPYIYRVPSDGLSAFWLINMALLLVPQLIAWRCLTWPEFFEAKPSERRDGKASLEQQKDK